MIPFEATPTGQKLFAAKKWFDRKMRQAQQEDVFGTMFELGIVLCFPIISLVVALFL